MSVSVADFCRDLVMSWVYIRSRTSESRRVPWRLCPNTEDRSYDGVGSFRARPR